MWHRFDIHLAANTAEKLISRAPMAGATSVSVLDPDTSPVSKPKPTAAVAATYVLHVTVS